MLKQVQYIFLGLYGQNNKMIKFDIINGLNTETTPHEGILNKEFEIQAVSKNTFAEDAIYEWKLQKPNNTSTIDIPDSQDKSLIIKLSDTLIDNKISNEGVYKISVKLSGYTDAGVVKTLDEGSVEIMFKSDLTEATSDELDTFGSIAFGISSILSNSSSHFFS